MQRSEGMQLIEKTWNHTQNQKKVTFLELASKSIIYKSLPILVTTERKLTGRQFLVVDLSQHS